MARRDERRQLATLSGWIAGYCARSKRFPSFDKLTRSMRGRQPQSLEEQIRTLEYITALWKK